MPENNTLQAWLETFIKLSQLAPWELVEQSQLNARDGSNDLSTVNEYIRLNRSWSLSQLDRLMDAIITLSHMPLYHERYYCYAPCWYFGGRDHVISEIISEALVYHPSFSDELEQKLRKAIYEKFIRPRYLADGVINPRNLFALFRAYFELGGRFSEEELQKIHQRFFDTHPTACIKAAFFSRRFDLYKSWAKQFIRAGKQYGELTRMAFTPALTEGILRTVNLQAHLDAMDEFIALAQKLKDEDMVDRLQRNKKYCCEKILPLWDEKPDYNHYPPRRQRIKCP